jgi:phasin family protein
MAPKSPKSAKAQKPAAIVAPVELVAQVAPTITDLKDFSRDSIEAANAAVSASVEAVSQEFIASAKAAFEGAGETVRALLSARTLQDVVQLQTDFAKAQFDRLVQSSAKLSEISVSLAGAALAPWSGRVGVGFGPLMSGWGKPTL